MKYRYNQYCGCSRCRLHGLMGPVILITIGVLFLFDQMLPFHHIGFDHSWPLLLIVIGLMSFLKHSASTAGHIPREYGAIPPYVPGQQIPPGQPYPGQGPVVTPPPVPPAGSIAPGTTITPTNWQNPNDQEVHRG